MRHALYGLVMVLLLSAAPAVAQNLTISAFFGRYEGSGIAENRESLYFGVTVRDMDVVIGPDGDGFFVEWTTVIRSGGDPANPDVRRRETRMAFDPTGRPGVYRARMQGDAIAGEAFAWASLAGTALNVYIMTIGDDGAHDVQRYERSLSDTGMQLVFSRSHDGEEVLMVKGRLVKVAAN